jgi:lipid-A-disaccharide synthase
MPGKIFLIACEASGDAHGAHLVEEIKKSNPSFEFTGLGGPKMAAAGVRILEDMTRLSALGLGDVVRKYLTYRTIFYRALDEVRRNTPDALILIDSPAFNLRFAKKIQKKIPVLYYISPQIWAWGGCRIHTIRKTVHKMLVILPFEVNIYEKAGIPCEFVGHPLLDQIRVSGDRTALRREIGITEPGRLVGLLSGSRESEVRRILPLMLESAEKLKEKLPDTIFAVALAPNIDRKIYDSLLKSFPGLNPRVIGGKLYELIRAADFALITSGTTTLEAALIGTPYFLLYKTGWSTYWLGRHLIRVPHLGLVNLLAGKSVVPEFIQYEIHPETIAHEAVTLLETPELYRAMKEEFVQVREMLGESGAGRRAAQAVLNFLKK